MANQDDYVRFLNQIQKVAILFVKTMHQRADLAKQN